LLCRSILGLMLCTAVAGCITTGEQLADRNNERCKARGLQPDTKNFNDCLAQLETEHDLRIESNRRAMTERSAAPSSNRGY
jgi:hypothetical protein